MATKHELKHRKLGLGSSSGNYIGLGDTTSDLITNMSQMLKCAPYALDTIAEASWTLKGPMSTQNVQKTLGDTIDIFGGGSAPAGIDEVYQTPGLEDGEFQVPMLVCAFNVSLEAGGFVFVARGNSFPVSTTGAQPKPFSPDVWSAKDQANMWTSSTPPSAPAILRYGLPALEYFWALVRSYNVRWSYGSQINIVDERLRESAFMPSNAQDGSASSSDIEVILKAAEVNARYVNNLASQQVFALINAIRVGTLSSGNGVFTPTGEFETVGVTYGSLDMRSKIGIAQNDEYRTLTNPRILRPGVKIGMRLEAQLSDLAAYARQQIDVDEGVTNATTPPTIVESSSFALGFGSNLSERALDNGAATVNNFPAQRALYKGFRMLMGHKLKGWELSDQLYETFKQNSQLAAALCSRTGCLL